MGKEKTVQLIFDAVEAATGVERRHITSGSHIREHYFARMIASHEFNAHGLPVEDICPLVGVTSPTAVRYQLKGYDSERTPYFRRCAEVVRTGLHCREG